MAEYFTNVSFTVAMTAEQADWVKRVHDAALDRVLGLGDAEDASDPDADPKDPCQDRSDIAAAVEALAKFDDAGLDNIEFQEGAEPALWISGDQVNCNYLAALLQQFLIHANDERSIAFEFSLDCSKPITDAFGGGAFVVSKDAIESMGTSSWVSETIKTFDIRRRAAAIARTFPNKSEAVEALDDAVHDAISQDASEINNSGAMEQIAVLLAAEWSQADIEALGSTVRED
jgi:hypothetical protein